MLETATYLVTKEIAIRSGLVDSRYRIADGRFVLNNRDLSRVRFEPDEYINGLEGVEKVTPERAKTLIRQNNFAIGLEVVEPVVEEQQETAIVDDVENANQGDETPIEENENHEQQENPEQQENTETETIDESEVGDVEDILGGGTQQEENTETEQQNQEEE